LPIKAVQFTILSIIALGYKAAVAPYGSEMSSKLLQIWKTQRLIKRYSMKSVIVTRWVTPAAEPEKSHLTKA
jgi:hypothetical protein